MANWNALTDPLPRWDPKSQELAYNNYTDRMRIELPEVGDPAASGVVSLNVNTLPPSGLPVCVDRWNGDSLMVWSASGTTDLPVYLTSPIPVAVAVDIETDSIKVFSSSGTADVPTYIQNEIRANVHGRVNADTSYTEDSIMVYSASGTRDIPVYVTSPISVIADIGDEIKVLSASGHQDLPVYIQNQVTAQVVGTVDVAVGEATDSIRVYSASGTSDLSTYIQNEVKANVTGRVNADTSYAEDSISVYSASGTANVGVYLTGRLDANVDSVSVATHGTSLAVINASATSLAINDNGSTISVDDGGGALTVDGTVGTNDIDPTNKTLLKKRYTYNDSGNTATLKVAGTATASGAACLLYTYIYDANNKLDYLLESLSTW